jgi:hypothetical protein
MLLSRDRKGGRSRPGVSEVGAGHRTLHGCAYGGMVSGVLPVWT